MTRTISLLIFIITILKGQTFINLGKQGNRVDFSNQSRTIPQRIVNALPSTCVLGEQAYLATAPAGENLYFCTGPNIWTINRGGNSTQPTRLSQLQDFNVTRATNTTLIVGSSCSINQPCLVQNGAAVTSITAPVTVTLTGTTTGTIYTYIDEANKIIVGATTGMLVSCSDPCQTAENATGFPVSSIALYQWGSFNAAGQWDQTGTDRRAVFRREVPVAGEGLVSQQQGNIRRWSLDTTVVSRYFRGNAAPIGTCQTGRDVYTETVSGNQFRCVNATWVLSASATWPMTLTGTIQLNPIGTQPSCDSSKQFQFWATAGGANSKDSVEVCVKAANNTFIWATLY